MLQITNLAGNKINRRLFSKVLEKTLKIVDGSVLGEISLVFVAEEKIKEINYQYRRKNEVTDGLSFEGLNEIFICPSFIKKQAKSLNTPFGSELMRVLIHGILHLKGFDHEKSGKEADKMRKLEEKILQNINEGAKR
ncbi:MAG: rRNA maturation RNase YbeY [Candidatus Portnoybacteria bacterium RBG_19FT_COMBO_36_7]|uniref:Endoribonuclease YbeY n=1 Tax=Candidatus Portnoybacteria bacterium RBG_19FT_COMBO_36_7 TaxID=1801992 RepID=A0A1G2F653_9BACT|nr:MAG: rRNA maturation RNase YbeY [Candidatus Portnoybacteria bacterium RBG_19FT_COMBO_36_7]